MSAIRRKAGAVFDLEIGFDGRADGLAVMGEALGGAGISVEGGGMFTVDGRAIVAAGPHVHTRYSDHDQRLILVTSDQPAAADATRAWDP